MWKRQSSFGNSDRMQFYTHLWLDTGLTLSQLGEWEERNLFEYESYMNGYVHRLKLQSEARERLENKQKTMRLK